MPGIATLAQLRSVLMGQGVRTAYVKLLSPRQDNEKNQIYLGGGLDAHFRPAPMNSLPRQNRAQIKYR